MTDSPGVEHLSRWSMARRERAHGWDKNEVYLRDLTTREGRDRPLVTGVEAIFDTTVRNDRIYIRTNDGAPRYKLYAVDPKRPNAQRGKRSSPKATDVLDDVTVLGSEIVATYLQRCLDADPAL